MESLEPHDSNGWLPSVYYAETTIHCSHKNAWDLMLNTPAWNPGLVGATIIRVRGEPNTEGEVLLICPVDASGAPLPPFYARTIKAVRDRCITWYCYPKLDEAFRIFLEFGLAEVPDGVIFSIRWYALDRISIESLAEQRVATQTGVHTLAVALKAYCESQATALAEGVIVKVENS